jgi:acetyl-CoA acyltransferase
MVPQGGLNFVPNPRLRSNAAAAAEVNSNAYISMIETAENVAARYRVSRAEQEQLAQESQNKAATAQSAGRLRDEVVPLVLPDCNVVDVDGCLRPNTTLNILAALKPVFAENGTVTAGTASPLTDGASAVLITSARFAAKHGLEVVARLKSVAVAGVEPEYGHRASPCDPKSPCARWTLHTRYRRD